MNHGAKVKLDTDAALAKTPGIEHVLTLRHLYKVECFDAQGAQKWVEEFENLVVTTGLNKYLDATLKTGLAVPAWFVGLITGPGAGNTYVAGDTSAAHPGWTENVSYTQPTRPAWTPGVIAAGSVDNSGSPATFSISAAGTIAGAFFIDNATKGGATGTLLGEGNFTGGDRVVAISDTLNVTIICTIS